MSPSNNLAMRIRRRLDRASARARYRFGFAEPDPGACQLARAFQHPIASSRRQALIAAYRTLFPDAVGPEIAEAHRLAAHRFDFLGHPVDHGSTIAWALDPVSGREWNDGLSDDIVYKGPARHGDIKLPWELSKHQYFFTLGKAGWLTGDPAFALHITRHIDDWIASNPYRRGINWISALEAGTRAVSWIVAYPFYADSGDAPFRNRLTRSLAQHMVFVEAHLSTGPYANNHLIGDAAALVAGGLFLDHRHSKRWLETGVAHLETEMGRQVTSDGVHVERSVSYHRFVLDQYHLTRSLLAANGRSLSAATHRGMERMTEFMMDVLQPDGTVPTFGDGDDARGIWFRADCPRDFRSLLALGAVLFGRGDFKTIAGGLTEEVLWLCGDDGVATFRDVPARLPAHTSAAYPEGGYYMMRSGWTASDAVLSFDCGPVGHGPAGHGHADTLSFQLYASGYRFLVDPGAFSYNLDYEWRDAFRATSSHNTVVVDDADQSVAADRMSWRTTARARTHRSVSTAWFDLVDGEHDGYQRLADPVTHRRIVAYLKPDLWVIEDRLVANAGHHLDLYLHMRPDCQVASERDGAGIVLHSPQGSPLYIRMFDDTRAPQALDVVTGTEQERAAWFSPGYGTRLPSRALRLHQDFTGRCTVVTCLSTHDIRPNLVDENGVFGFTLRRGADAEDRLLYRTGAGRLPLPAGSRSDGVLHFERRVQNVPTVVWAMGFQELSLDGIVDVRASALVGALVLDRDHCDVTIDPGHAAGLQVKARAGLLVSVNGVPYRDG